MKRAEVSRATLGRIPIYLEYLKNINRHTRNISATALAKELGLGEVQVRKDLGAVSGAGRPKTGYPVEQLIEELETFLGCGKKRDNVVIVGAGKLGRALLAYRGFPQYGLNIYPMERFDDFCKNHPVKIGIITVPASQAQQVCDRLVLGGIRAIWCFAPCALCVPPEIPVQYENMALSLAYLNKKIG